MLHRKGVAQGARWPKTDISDFITVESGDEWSATIYLAFGADRICAPSAPAGTLDAADPMRLAIYCSQSE